MTLERVNKVTFSHVNTFDIWLWFKKELEFQLVSSAGVKEHVTDNEITCKVQMFKPGLIIYSDEVSHGYWQPLDSLRFRRLSGRQG